MAKQTPTTPVPHAFTAHAHPEGDTTQFAPQNGTSDSLHAGDHATAASSCAPGWFVPARPALCHGHHAHEQVDNQSTTDSNPPQAIDPNALIRQINDYLVASIRSRANLTAPEQPEDGPSGTLDGQPEIEQIGGVPAIGSAVLTATFFGSLAHAAFGHGNAHSPTATPEPILPDTPNHHAPNASVNTASAEPSPDVITQPPTLDASRDFPIQTTSAGDKPAEARGTASESKAKPEQQDATRTTTPDNPSSSDSAPTTGHDDQDNQKSTDVETDQATPLTNLETPGGNAAHDDNGSFNSAELDSSAQLATGTATQQEEKHESPVVPHYDAQTGPTRVAHNSETGFALSQLTGVVSPSDSTVSPSTGYIRITAINENADQDTNVSPLSLKPANGQAPYTPIKQGSEIAVEDLPRLVWHSAHNEGGSFRFIPLDTNKHEILGAHEQQVQVYESPLPPSYPASQEVQVSVPHDTVHALDARLFNGDTQHLAPAHIRVESLSETSGTSGGQATLMLHRGQSGARELTTGSVVAQADFAALSWDSRNNDGGSFRFIALDKNQVDIVGSQPMTVAVQESPPLPPAYADYGKGMSIGHDRVHTFDPSIFIGSDPQRAPSAVWIETLVEEGDTDPNSSPLMIDRGQTNARPVSLVDGYMVLAAADFSKLSWDASGNTGGKFVFWPLDKNNQLIPNGRDQTITIVEHPAPPTYATPLPVQRVGHNDTLTLDNTLFEGSANTARFIRIESIHPKPDPGASPATGALKMDHDGTPATPSQTVAPNIVKNF